MGVIEFLLTVININDFAAGQNPAYPTTQSINHRMNLGAQPTTRSPDFKAPIFLWAPSPPESPGLPAIDGSSLTHWLTLINLRAPIPFGSQ
jgi:hypothetical protein